MANVYLEEYKEYRKLTRQVNKRLKEYYKTVGANELLDKEVEHLKSITGSRGHYISLYKPENRFTEQTLYAANRELRYFLEWDMATPEGHRQFDKKEKDAYKKFIENPQYADITIQEWREYVEVFGALGDDILKSYGSGETAELMNVARENKVSKKKFMDIAIDTYKKVSQDKSIKTDTKLKETLYEEMRKELEK